MAGLGADMIGAVRPKRAMRTITPVLPARIGRRDGLAYSLWLPDRGLPRGAVVILHGAGSRKENHHDFARAAVANRLAALAVDQRGHGESAGPLDERALRDVVTMVELVRQAARAQRPSGARPLPVALRGSSMGGYLAILAAAPARVQAVIAICPASGESLARGIESGQLGFDADRSALLELLAANDLGAAVAALEVPLLLLHAEGDERVPVEHSRELAALARCPGSRLVVVPGGHHRSVQHDPELQALSLRFLSRWSQLPD